MIHVNARSSLSSCLLGALLALAGCGGGGGGGASSPATPPPSTPPPVSQLPDALVRVSADSLFGANCDGSGTTAGLYVNAEVEPSIAVNPRDGGNLVGVWQQDRWASGSARGIVAAASFDGGATWQRQAMPYSRCGGGSFLRVSDPWVSFGPDGVAYQDALASSGGSFQPQSVNALLASRSVDGGRTWSAPVALITDDETHFNDKNSITADPTDARYAYAVWDRLPAVGDSGPSYLARTADRGVTWEAAKPIYDAGPSGQTINNQAVVLPDGTIVVFFTQFDTGPNRNVTTSMGVVRSTDKGLTWSPRIKIADVGSVGTKDPETGTTVRDATNLGSIAVGPGGTLNVVWQDARSSGGARDAIHLSRSTDGGLTWSAPVRVSADPTVPAFTPAIGVRADGTLGVTYYDFRSNTADPQTLPTDYWLTRSTDGVTWRESRVAGPFDLSIAPNAGGLFLGDYQSLAMVGNVFVPFFAQTNDGNQANRTDIFVDVARNASAGAAPGNAAKRAIEAAPAVAEYRAEPAPPLVITKALQQAMNSNVASMMERRVPGWSRRGQPAQGPR